MEVSNLFKGGSSVVMPIGVSWDTRPGANFIQGIPDLYVACSRRTRQTCFPQLGWHPDMEPFISKARCLVETDYIKFQRSS